MFFYVVKVIVYIVGVEYWSSFNVVYVKVFGEVCFVWLVVLVLVFYYGYFIEFDVVVFDLSDID